MSVAAQPDLLVDRDETVADSINDRLSQEMVIALVGPVGSGVSTAAKDLHDILTQQFAYDVAPIIKPSSIIAAEAHRVRPGTIQTAPLSSYIHEMQTAGNLLRQRFGANYLAEKTVERIFRYRVEKGGYKEINGKSIPMPGRRAYIIDSIKNMEELELLRQIYGDTLCLVGVFAPDEVRRRRLIDEGAQAGDVQKILDRDQGEVATFGQMTRKVFVEADFFICNDQKKDVLRRGIERYLHILFDTSIHTPTRAESAMYEADAASSNSACMSRRVGAAVVSKTGELIAVGWNDVPKFGGGLYGEDDQSIWDGKAVSDRDHRCFKWGQRICHNETRRNAILDGIAARIAKSGLLKKGVAASEVRDLLGGTEVDSLTEYSRSIHAEMEAILAVAREGRHSLVGASLYTTTYPCHNCARHIVAAGIASVIYIQPYQKSLATALHHDAVTEDRDDQERVVFRQYDGVAPRKFLRLFQPTSLRKKDGKLSRQNPKVALPVFRVPLDSPVDYEAKIIADLSKKEQD
jgi:deoxycytidylate deaminase